MRQTGQQMGDDAERAGQQAGQQLGEGLVRGADGRLRNARGQFVSSARRIGDDAGDALGDGLADGAGEGADDAVDQAGSKLEQLKAVAGGAALAAGAAAGALFISAFSEAMDQSKITARLGAQLGKTPAEAQRFGKIAGQLYSEAVTEDFQGAADAIRATMSSGLLPPAATTQQIKEISTQVSDLAGTFELDLGQAANAAGQMIKTGLARNGRHALDIMAKGLQGLGPRADDIADTFNEYSTIFRNVGLDGQTAMGLIRQGMLAGARDTDVVADSVKEFTIEAVAGGERVRTGFESLGLSADDMVNKFAAGGPTAAKAFDTVLDKLRGIEDPAKRNAVAIELFGTKAEDMGDALYALDPSEAVKELGEVGGAAEKMGNALRDNAGSRLEAFKRGMQQNLVEFLGGPVLGSIAKVRTGLGRIWDEAGKGGTEGADRVVAFFGLVGQRLLAKARELGPKFITGLSQAGQKVAEFITSNPEAALKLSLIAAAIVGALMLLPVLVAGAIAASATLMMVSFVQKLISSLNENLTKWWAAFTAWVSRKAVEAPAVFNAVGTAIGAWFSSLWSRYIAGPVSRQWDSWMTSVRGLPGRAVAALNPLGTNLTAVASRAWQQFKDSAARKGAEFVSWVRGLPRRIASNLGSMGSLLSPQGRAVVQGLWSGISSMGGWLRSRIMGWARSAIPGPIAKALGIASPSKVTTAQGRWIARGLVAGLTGTQKQVRAASYKLVDIVRDSLGGKRLRNALKTINKGAGKLDWLAGWDAKLAGQLKTARKKVDDLVKARDKLAADVRKGVLDSANITQQDAGGWPQTAESILAGLKQDTAAAQTFAKNLAALRKKGVSGDLVAQIAQAGVDGGSAAAAALANANQGQIKQINAQQRMLVTAAGQAGSTAGNAMYGAGVEAARGLVKGLAAHQKQIEKQMLTIAKGMSKSIRKALGIKSPSRVMALVGRYTAQGLVKGVAAERSAVNSAMASLVDTPAPGSWDTASSSARRAASQRIVLEMRSSGRGEDDYLMERMRRGIRRKAGGDVDYALAGRRRG